MTIGMGTVQHQEMDREHLLREVWGLDGEVPMYSILCSHSNGTAGPSVMKAGRFYVPRVAKKNLIDEKNEPSHWS